MNTRACMEEDQAVIRGVKPAIKEPDGRAMSAVWVLEFDWMVYDTATDVRW